LKSILEYSLAGFYIHLSGIANTTLGPSVGPSRTKQAKRAATAAGKSFGKAKFERYVYMSKDMCKKGM
jgi:hypothetical protein